MSGSRAIRDFFAEAVESFHERERARIVPTDPVERDLALLRHVLFVRLQGALAAGDAVVDARTGRRGRSRR